MKMAKRDLGVVTCQVMLEASKCIEEGVCVVVYQRGGALGSWCVMSVSEERTASYTAVCVENGNLLSDRGHGGVLALPLCSPHLCGHSCPTASWLPVHNNGAVNSSDTKKYKPRAHLSVKPRVIGNTWQVCFQGDTEWDMVTTRLEMRARGISGNYRAESEDVTSERLESLQSDRICGLLGQ